MVLLKRYENSVATIHQLVKQLHINITASTINRTIQSHPDYPSLLSISDSLTKWGIQNVAVPLQPTEITNYPLPLLLTNGTMYCVVTAIAKGFITYFNAYGKRISENAEKFFSKMGGVHLHL